MNEYANNTQPEAILDQIAHSQDFGALWSGLNRTQRGEVLDDVMKETVELFKTSIEQLDDAAGLEKPDREKALKMLVARAPEIWRFLRRLDPRQYDRDMRDFRRYAEDALEGGITTGVPPAAQPVKAPVRLR